jgi:hypothetical protein
LKMTFIKWCEDFNNGKNPISFNLGG